MITQRGIYLDIKESTFRVNYLDYNFYFSSKFNQNRFKEKVETYVKTEENKIKNRYQINKINLKLFFAVVFYVKIEKRGFRIFDILHNKLYYEKEDIKFIIKIKE